MGGLVNEIGDKTPLTGGPIGALVVIHVKFGIRSRSQVVLLGCQVKTAPA